MEKPVPGYEQLIFLKSSSFLLAANFSQIKQLVPSNFLLLVYFTYPLFLSNGKCSLSIAYDDSLPGSFFYAIFLFSVCNRHGDQSVTNLRDIKGPRLYNFPKIDISIWRFIIIKYFSLLNDICNKTNSMICSRIKYTRKYCFNVHKRQQG